MSTLPARQRMGIPIGGQFAATAHSEPALSLPRHPIEPATPTTRPSMSNHHLDAKWDDGLAELAAWVEAHGALPRRRSEDPDEQRSANWLNVQRTHRRKNTLDPDRVTRLDAIPGALEVTARANRITLPGGERRQRTVNEQVSDLADFYKERRRLPQKQSGPAVQSLEHSLYLSLDRARSKVKDGTLPPKVLAVLRRIPGAITDGSTIVMTLDEVRAFATEHGNLPTDGTDSRLYHVLRRALTGRGSVRPDVAEDLRQEAEALVGQFPHDPTRHAEHVAARYLRTPRAAVVVDRLEAIEDYVREHGYRPGSATPGVFGSYKDMMQRMLGMPSTPEELRGRINAILAAPTALQSARPRQPSDEFAAKLSSALEDVRAYALQTGHLPKVTDQVRLYGRMHRALKGTASTNPELAGELQRQAVALTEEFPSSLSLKLITRLDGVEDYIRTNGHRPLSGKDGLFGFYRPQLVERLKSPETPEDLKTRIRAILAAPTAG